jgi:pleiotropic regulator 1
MSSNIDSSAGIDGVLRRLLQRHSKEVSVVFSKEPISIAARDEGAAATALRVKLAATEFSGVPTSAERVTIQPQLTEEIAKRIKTSASDLALITTPVEVNAVPAEAVMSRALQVRKVAEPDIEPEKQHKWKLARVFAGHRGVPRAVAVDPSNRIYATGGMDNVIKIFDVATGKVMMNFEGHSHPIRGLAFSPRHPYLFSASEDKDVKAWDLELNQIVRQYHGHTGGVYCVAVHPTLDTIISAGRDGTCRVWDMRSRTQVYCMTGHKEAVISLAVQATAPQVVTGSEDSMVRTWSLESGRSMQTLTYHKKGVRSLALHPSQFSFASGSTGSVKKCNLPEGMFMQDFQWDSAEPKTIVHSLAASRDGKFLVGGTDDGYLKFWDWTSAKSYQKLRVKTMPGTLETEAGVMALAFDMTGDRLFACMGDKTVQMYKPDVPQTGSE